MSATQANSRRLWCQFKHELLAWQSRSSFGTELTDLSDSILRDIGLSRGCERLRPAMPFWLP